MGVPPTFSSRTKTARPLALWPVTTVRTFIPCLFSSGLFMVTFLGSCDLVFTFNFPFVRILPPGVPHPTPPESRRYARSCFPSTDRKSLRTARCRSFARAQSSYRPTASPQRARRRKHQRTVVRSRALLFSFGAFGIGSMSPFALLPRHVAPASGRTHGRGSVITSHWPICCARQRAGGPFAESSRSTQPVCRTQG